MTTSERRCGIMLISFKNWTFHFRLTSSSAALRTLMFTLETPPPTCLLWKSVNKRDTRQSWFVSKVEVWINPCHPDCLSGVYDTTLIVTFKVHIKITAKLSKSSTLFQSEAWIGFYFSCYPGFHYVPSFLFNINLIPPFRPVNNSFQLRSMTTLRNFSPKDFIDDLQAINRNNIGNHTYINQSFSRFYRCVKRKLTPP